MEICIREEEEEKKQTALMLVEKAVCGELGHLWSLCLTCHMPRDRAVVFPTQRQPQPRQDLQVQQHSHMCLLILQGQLDVIMRSWGGQSAKPLFLFSTKIHFASPARTLLVFACSLGRLLGGYFLPFLFQETVQLFCVLLAAHL